VREVNGKYRSFTLQMPEAPLTVLTLVVEYPDGRLVQMIKTDADLSAIIAIRGARMGTAKTRSKARGVLKTYRDLSTVAKGNRLPLRQILASMTLNH
jgi:hypothetical protein